MSQQSEDDARRRNRRRLIPFGVCFFFGLMDLFIGALISRQSPQESTEAELARLKEQIAELAQRGQKRTS